MYSYIAKRVLMTIPTLIGAAALVFILMRLIPGDICVVRLGSGGGSFSEHSVQMCHAELGIDRPMIVQFADFVWGLFTLNLGNSMWSGKPVVLEIATRLPISIEIALLAAVVAIVVAIPLGTISALKQNTWLDLVVRTVAIAGIATPSFWLGILSIVLVLNVSPGDHRVALDAADRVCAAVEGSDPQPVDDAAAGDHRGVPLRGGVDADDPLDDAGGDARGLHPHRARQGPAAPHHHQPARAEECAAAGGDACWGSSSLS